MAIMRSLAAVGLVAALAAPAAELCVEVTDPFGAPLENVRISLQGGDRTPQRHGLLLRTDFRGRSCSHHDPGTWTVLASAPARGGVSYPIERKVVEIAPRDAAVAVRIELNRRPAYRLEGVVFGALPGSIATPMIVAQPVEQPASGPADDSVYGAFVGAGGRFVLNGLPAGRYRLLLGAFGGAEGARVELESIFVAGDRSDLVLRAPF